LPPHGSEKCVVPMPPRITASRFNHAPTYSIAADRRPTVGSIVKVRGTANTRQYASELIGRVVKISTDVKGHQPYRVESSDVWFYETDVDPNTGDRAPNPGHAKPGMTRPSQPLGDGGSDRCLWPPQVACKPNSWGDNREWFKRDSVADSFGCTREATTESQMLTREPTAETYMFTREPTAESQIHTRESPAENFAWDSARGRQMYQWEGSTDWHAWQSAADWHAWGSAPEWSAPSGNGFQNAAAGTIQPEVYRNASEYDEGGTAANMYTERTASATWCQTQEDNTSTTGLASEERPSFTLGGHQLEVHLRGTFLHVGLRSPTSRRAKSEPCTSRHDRTDIGEVGDVKQMYIDKLCGDVEQLWDSVASGSPQHGASTNRTHRSFTFGSICPVAGDAFGIEGAVSETTSFVSPALNDRCRSTSSANDEPLSTSTALDHPAGSRDLAIPPDPSTLDLDALAATMTPSQRELLKEFALGSPELPTVGSAGHYLAHCKPCCFVHTKGCENGVACVFCHLCDAGEKKRRQKERYEKKKRQWRHMLEKRLKNV